jgi:hypothetical protein
MTKKNKKVTFNQSSISEVKILQNKTYNVVKLQTVIHLLAFDKWSVFFEGKHSLVRFLQNSSLHRSVDQPSFD